MENRSINFFQSANLTDEESRQHFVVRQHEFHRIIGEIRRDNMEGAVQHFIMLGQRGSGKSTLLRRIEAEIRMDKKLEKKFLVVNLSEEQAGIYRLHDVWDAVIREMKEGGISVDEVLWTDYPDDNTAYSKQLFLSIQKVLKKEKKKLILLVDNIDRIFDAIGDDSHLLRELLTNYNDMRIIGGSTRMSEHYWGYDKPFYQFFSLIRLEALSADEVKDLLLYWSGFLNQPVIKKFVEEQPGKLNTVRILTDGMPRTLLYFIQLLVDRPHQNGFDYLLFILDQATPIYQERLLKLPPAQRKIVLELSFFWDAVKVQQLIEKCKMTGKVISAQLSQLEKSGIVEKIKGQKKNHIYRISERFFNLWLIMTQGGPAEKHQVKYLTLFLESWYDQVELQQIFSAHLDSLKSGSLQPGHAAMMTKALAHLKFITVDERDELINKTTDYKGVSEPDVSYLPETSEKIFERTSQLIEEGEYEKAREELDLIDQESGEKCFYFGLSFQLEGKKEAAIEYYLQAIEKGHGGALNNLTKMYWESGEKEKVETYLLQAIEKGNIEALNNLASMNKEIGQVEKAEDLYLQAIEKDFSGALNNLGLMCQESGRTEEAEKYYLQAIEKGVAGALFNLAVLYYSANHKSQAVLQLMMKLIQTEDKLIYQAAYVIFLLWAGKMKEFSEMIQSVFVKALTSEDAGMMKTLITNLLIHHQSGLVWGWFGAKDTGEKLKKIVRPLYFVAAGFISKPATKEELLKAGPELQESIEQIREFILKRQEFYYGKPSTI